MSLALTHLVGFGAKRAAAGGGGAAATVSYVATYDNITGGTSFTFSGASLGSGGYIIIGIVGNAVATAVTGVTVDGNAATVSARASDAQHVAFAAIVNPNPGGTADIVVSVSVSTNRQSIFVWAADNLGSLAAYDHDYSETVTSNAYNISIDVPAGGVAVAVAFSNTPNTLTITWSGLTESGSEYVWGSSRITGGAADAFASAQTPLAIQAQWSSAPSAGVIGAASFSGS